MIIALSKKNVPDALHIMCINCGKMFGCTLYNRSIEDFINIFPQCLCFSMLFYLGSSIKKEIRFDFEIHCISWILNGPWYNTTIFQNGMVHILKIMLQLQEKTDTI